MPLKPEESLIGKTFEKCRILAKLGTGGMGSVYMAEHFGLGRKVALKILPIEMSRDPEYVGRFMREATTAGRMEHPNIVQIHDVGYAEGRHFIVMQYVDGESLSTVVDELGAMEPRDAARLAVGILRGLQHAHEQGIVHRDVKPDNVLITKGNEPKLLDFGLAIETEASLHITRDGMVVGTPYYLSPEQARGQKATPICDVYATGVTLYYLVTGKRPFVGATALAVLNKHIHEQAVPPMQHNKAVPRTLNDIILKMMAKKPELRYQTAGAAADALEAFLEGRPVDAKIPFRPSDLAARFLGLPLKLRIAAGAGAGVLLLLLVLALLPGKKPTAGPSTPEHATAPAESTDSRLLAEALENESGHRNDLTAWEGILEKYRAVVRAVSSPEVKQKAETELARFAKQTEQRADSELAKLKGDSDPALRAKELAKFPAPLLSFTAAGAKVRDELAQIPQLLERKFDDDDAKAVGFASSGRFREARDLAAAMRAYAPPSRQDRMAKIGGDLDRLERDFNDPLAKSYAAVHAAFEQKLGKRLVRDAFDAVVAFLRAPRDSAETDRLRSPAVNYDRLFAIRPEADFPVDLLNDARFTLADALQKGDDRLAFAMLSDLLDALDLAWLFNRTRVGLNQLDQSKKELTLATFNASGRVSVGPPYGVNFIPKSGAEKKIVIGELRAGDLVLLAAAAEDQTPETAYQGNALLCRAAGAAWLYSEGPARLAESIRWSSKAAELHAPGSSFRLEKLREQGRREARERLSKDQADARAGKFEAARRDLAELQSLWSFDPAVKDDVRRAAASLLSAEVPRAAEARDYARVKTLSRELRAGYDGLFDEAAILKLHAHALKTSGFWEFVPTDLAKTDGWTWEARGTGAPAPVKDEGAATGLRFPAGVAVVTIVPARTRGRSGLSIQLRVTDSRRPYSCGIRFDVSEADGRYKLLAFEFPGRVALYQVEGSKRQELKSVALDPRPAQGQWLDLAYMSEGGDLVCSFDQKPLFWIAAPVPADRPVQLASDADVNIRQIHLRK